MNSSISREISVGLAKSNNARICEKLLKNIKCEFSSNRKRNSRTMADFLKKLLEELMIESLKEFMDP